MGTQLLCCRHCDVVLSSRADADGPAQLLIGVTQAHTSPQNMRKLGPICCALHKHHLLCFAAATNTTALQRYEQPTTYTNTHAHPITLGLRGCLVTCRGLCPLLALALLALQVAPQGLGHPALCASCSPPPPRQASQGHLCQHVWG